MSIFAPFTSPSPAKSPADLVPSTGLATSPATVSSLSPHVGMSESERMHLFNSICGAVLRREGLASRGEIAVLRTGIPVPAMSPEEWRVKRAMDSCGFKTALSCVAGAAFGGVFGLFTAAVDPNITGTETPTTRLVLKEMGSRMASYSKNFAIIGAMFACTECVIETHRAKDDWCNSPMAGAVTGGLIGLRTGLMGAVLGGTGFAIFSLAIDYYLKS